MKTISTLVLLCSLFALNSLHLSAQTPDSWTQKVNFGGAERYGAVGFSIGTKGYLGTGWTTARTVDFWEYDPTTDVWTQRADFGGTPRVFASGFSIGTKGYVGCGDDATGTTKDFWEYDPVVNHWTQKADFGGLARKGAVGFTIGSKAYVGTGLLDVSTRSKDFWEYDPATDTWTKKADVGGPVRAYAAGFNIGNNGYIGTGNSGTLEKDFWEYNPGTDIWTQKTDFTGLARFGALGLSIGTFGYIGLGDPGTAYSNDFWEYDPASDTWTQKASFGGEVRTHSTGFSISNKIFAGTGCDLLNTVKYVDFWEYTSTCTPPEIISEPTSLSITYGASASYSVTAALDSTYQWQQDAGLGFTDITDGGLYSGATNDTLIISLPTVEMTGNKYRCIITGPCLLTSASDGTATLTVAPMDVAVTPDAGQTKIYGTADPAPFTYTFAPSLLGTDATSGMMGRTTGEDAGDYTFIAGTLTAGDNYKLTVAAVPTFAITPAALTITAEDKEKCFDGTTYTGSYTVSYNGFVNTDDESKLGGNLVFGGTSSTGILAGNYSIDPSGLTSVNYIIGYVNGTLLIKAAPDAANITMSGDSIFSSLTAGNQWYLDGAEIIGSTGDVEVATVNGNYYTVITQDGCSSAPSNTIAIVDVSIKEFGSEIFDIYPNPSNGVFNIKLKTPGKSLYNIDIYNSMGALVYKQDNISMEANSSKTLDLKGLKPGLYTIVLKNSSISSVKKIDIL